MVIERIVGDGLIFISTGLIVACVIAYAWTTGDDWRGTNTGRHLMWFMTSLASVLVVWSIRLVAVDILGHVDPRWFYDIRLAVFATVPIVFAWRLAIIINVARTTQPEDTTKENQRS